MDRERSRSEIARSSLNGFVLPSEIPVVDIREKTYANGFRVISERAHGSTSVSVGLWVRAGSQDESESKAGIAHFIEHTVFKGTAGKSMREIMRSVESRGGILNAFTTKEHTCYYTWTRTSELARSIDVLFELAARPKFTERDIRREQSVVIEEINGLEDEPDELVFDFFERELYGAAPLGRPIIGTLKSVRSLTRQDLLRFHARHYSAGNLVLVVSGSHEHAELFAILEGAIRHLPQTKASGRPLKKATMHKSRTRARLDRAGGPQAHLILGRTAPGVRSQSHAALNVLVTLLGVGMSSRLNLRLREELGLAYDSTAFYTPYERTGNLGIYIATAEENFNRTEKEMRQILKGLFSKPVSEAELLRTKEQMIGSMLLSLESVTTRMMRAGQNALYYEKYVPVERELRKIAEVTLREVRDAANTFFKDESKLSLVSVQPERSTKS